MINVEMKCFIALGLSFGRVWSKATIMDREKN
jgi:hypothetical protein